MWLDSVPSQLDGDRFISFDRPAKMAAPFLIIRKTEQNYGSVIGSFAR